MKFQELYDYDCKLSSKQKPSKLFGRNTTKVKHLSLVFGFLLISSGFYFVGKKVIVDQVNAMQSLLSDVNERVNQRDVNNLHQKFKRNALDGDDTTEQTLIRGATYIRWGRRNCDGPEHTSTIYEGVSATEHYNHPGGGSNVLCLNQNISYTEGKYVDGFQASGRLHGVEYIDQTGLLDLTRTAGTNINHFNVPCAVCMAANTINQLMIPSRETCPTHWKKEYTGYIMVEAYNHKHSGHYLCIDDTPDVVIGSVGDQTGGYLYFAETRCPALPCEPFVDGREVRCVVCTL